ncbi:MAG TPA: urate hydroxylase PuuD [Candidatus Dormibacteraeota bacterium]|nr:urate hydroxylase PuuD [Candidatus Dormibacteraeota bacterium]
MALTVDPHVTEWLNLVLRWIHVFSGILWVGTTYYFTWLDAQFANEADEVWMVHSGGFYVVQKQKQLALLPRKLHWFKWEAAVTWLSGIALLTLMYYMGGILLDDSVSRISLVAGILIGSGVIAGAWFVYDAMVRSAIARSGTLFASVSFLLVLLVAFVLTHLLSARAAYIHVGAALGTIMTANVWERILPAQRKLVAALQAGQTPDATLAAQAKLRSKHNTYIVVPLVFLMISNHYPVATYGSDYNWEILGALVLVGWGAAKLIRRA